MTSSWAEQALAVLRKDILVEARSRTSVNAMIFFAATVLLIFSFALGPNPDRLKAATGGLLWLAFVFAGLLAFGRTYQLELENNAWEGVLLIARHRSAIYLGKVLGAAVVIYAVEVVIVPLMAILYNLGLGSNVPALILVTVLGTLGYAAIGALYGALTLSLRAREILLPLLLLPVVVPLLLAAVEATNAVFTGSGGDIHLWLEVLAAFDIIFLTIGLLTFEYAVGD